jgi:hypothetical protein
VFSRFPSLKDLNIPNADKVEAQQGEFEILMRSGPIPNPQLAPLADHPVGREEPDHRGAGRQQDVHARCHADAVQRLHRAVMGRNGIQFQHHVPSVASGSPR